MGRRELRADPELASTALVPLRSYLARSEGIPRLTTVLAVAFGATALLLAALGLYGIVAYSVTRRTAEIGLRVALGARPSDLVAWVVGQGFRLAVAGAAAGLTASAALAGVWRATLLEADAPRPAVLAAAAALLIAVAALAAWLPRPPRRRNRPGRSPARRLGSRFFNHRLPFHANRGILR